MASRSEASSSSSVDRPSGATGSSSSSNQRSSDQASHECASDRRKCELTSWPPCFHSYSLANVSYPV